MSVLGLIVEYNPFHNGHLYHFNTSLAITQAEYSICVISGNFVQRGEPALVDKWSRTRMALKAGVDLCIELPVIYCVQSAEFFAFGAVSILNKLGIVDSLCFGSETGDIGLIKSIGSIIESEPEEYRNHIREGVKSGKSFVSSRAMAIIKYLRKNKSLDIDEEALKKVLQSSNNILALEYVKWLYRLKSSITPFTIKRMGSNYNDETLRGSFASATALRRAIKSGDLNHLEHYMPAYAVDILKEQFNLGKGPISSEDFSQPILCSLRRMTNHEISKIMDVNEGLHNRIKKAAITSGSLNELIEKVKSKRYTETRIKRILTHSLLGLYKEDLLSLKGAGGPQYIRVLGFSEKGKKLLAMAKSSCDVPIITNTADYRRYQNSNLKKMIELDIMATDIYATAYNKDNLKIGGFDFYNMPERV